MSFIKRVLSALAVGSTVCIHTLFSEQSDIEFFETKIRPVFAEKCYSCHSHNSKKLKAGLFMDSRAGLLKGGDSGPSIIPGKPEKSLLVEAIRYLEPDFQMPPKSKLTDSQIKDIEIWISKGAPWPNEAKPVADGPSKEFNLAKRRDEHWSWEPVSEPKLPIVKDRTWSSHPVDHFVLSQLEDAGLKPSESTDRRSLIRRLTFALHGLPPSPSEVESFASDKSSGSIENLVDRLLDSPKFGERWARHWLDLVRYAESRGHEFDYNAANAFRYRDYVIRAFNNDVPYNQFVTEHIAGDLLSKPRQHPEQGFNESILGTGFWFLGEWVHSPVDIRQDEADRYDNMVDVATKTFLGLTVACARCHDHKFDAISTKDFYALNGFLQSSNYRQARFETITHNGKIAKDIDDLERTQGQQVWKTYLTSLHKEVQSTSEYLSATKSVFDAGVVFDEGDISLDPGSDIIFADFEDGTYQGWKATGDAFGKSPVTDKTKADYQKDIRHRGKFFVNSHQTRDGGKGDGHIGTLTSPEFTIERDFISFLLGGGGHRGSTCLNLVVEGKPVGTATGPSSNTMVSKFWDVRKFRGKTAHIEAIDNHTSGWGNIGFDHVVFTNHRPTGGNVVTVAKEQKFAKTTLDKIKTVAASLKLNPERLERWVRALEVDGRKTTSPLYPIAQAIMGKPEAVSSRAEALRKEMQAKETAYQKALGKLNVVIDYGSSKPEEFLQDGYTFGARPVRPGSVLWGTDNTKPILGVSNYGAARKDPAWHGLKIVDSELDSGSGLRYPRAGMTLRTPTFNVDHGKVFYLFRGEATVLAVVDSHRMVQGPLHGNTKIKTGKEGELNWYSHSLDRRGQSFIGHRVHIEFTPTKENFELLMVVQGDDREARETILRYHKSSKESLLTANLNGDSFTQLAQSFEDAIEKEGLSWLMENIDLFGGVSPVAQKSLTNFISARNELISKIRKESRTAMAMQDGSPEDEYVFIRGNYRNQGDVVPRRFLEALGGKPIDASGSGRLLLAQQMVSPENPYISRVIANRIWHHLFGRGIVASTDDFGYLGQRPTHPRLLDHLATQFMNDGWSIKKLIKHIVLSRTFQMSSQASDSVAEKKDPTNQLLHRMPVRRLEGEAIRDAILSISGRLDSKMYGKPVPIYLNAFMTGRGRPGNGPLDGSGRRSVYLSVRRNFLSPMMLTFDTPSPFSSVGRRTVSNVPSQALMMMNDPFVVAEAKRWGESVRGEGGSIENRIISMYSKAFSRKPTQEELSVSEAFLERQSKLNPSGAWQDLAHVLFNAKEFIYLN